jgi:ATP-dependent protease ClpP protease subunit
VGDQQERVRTAEEIAAEVAKATAEAAKFTAEAAKAAAEARTAELAVERAEIETQKAREVERDRLLDDDHQRLYRFTSAVTDSSVANAVKKLTVWSRTDPGCDITIVFDSPGGSILDGFHLFDAILNLRAKGHHVTTWGQGMVASMASVLLQAGDHRVLTPQTSVLLHEAKFWAVGSYGQVKDEVEFVEKLQDRILTIFAARSKLTKTAIKNKWTRREWWMLADEALKHGFADEIRG